MQSDNEVKLKSNNDSIRIVYKLLLFIIYLKTNISHFTVWNKYSLTFASITIFENEINWNEKRIDYPIRDKIC